MPSKPKQTAKSKYAGGKGRILKPGEILKVKGKGSRTKPKVLVAVKANIKTKATRDPKTGLLTGKEAVYTPEERKKAKSNRENAYQRAIDIQARDIAPLPMEINWKRRNACKHDLRLFQQTYMSTMFDKGYSSDQLKGIAKIEQVFLEGGKFAWAMPRGAGKTSNCRSGILWGTAFAHKQFAFFIGSKEDMARQSLELIKTYWYQSTLLQQDFPEIGYPIVQLENRFHRAKGQLYECLPTHIDWSVDRIVYPCLLLKGPVLKYYQDHDPDFLIDVPNHEGCITKSAGTIIITAGIDGTIRGESPVHPMTLQARRPDLIMLDDVQKDQKADSPSACQKLMNMIDGTIQGLAPPGKHIAALMPCTVIRQDDVADTYIDPQKKPEWRGERCAMVTSWPDGISDWEISLETVQGQMWTEYAELRKKSQRMLNNTSLSDDYYRENRKIMDQGFEVSWEARYDPDIEISAQQHAMNLRISAPEAFAWEYQNQGRRLSSSDLTIITAKQLAKKVLALPPGHLTADTQFVTGFIDVQDEILFWAVLGVNTDFTGMFSLYGTYPSVTTPWFTKAQAGGWGLLTNEFFKAYPHIKEQAQRTETGRLRAPLEAKIYHALTKCVPFLMGKEFIRQDSHNTTFKIQKLAIDTRWGQCSEVVKRFIRESGNKDIMAYQGQSFPATNLQLEEYQQTPGWLFEHQRNPNVKESKWVWRSYKGDGMYYMSSDVNRFKDFLFARLGSPLGHPGSIALFNAPAEKHEMFTSHICSSEYPEPVAARGRIKNQWQERGGYDNDYLDCAVGCCCMASFLGASVKTADTKIVTKQTLREKYDLKRAGRSTVRQRH